MKTFKTHIEENKDHVETHMDVVVPDRHDSPEKAKKWISNYVQKKGGPSNKLSHYVYDGPGGGHPAVSVKGHVKDVMKLHNHHNDEKFSHDHEGHKKMSKEYGFDKDKNHLMKSEGYGKVYAGKKKLGENNPAHYAALAAADKRHRERMGVKPLPNMNDPKFKMTKKDKMTKDPMNPTGAMTGYRSKIKDHVKKDGPAINELSPDVLDRARDKAQNKADRAYALVNKHPTVPLSPGARSKSDSPGEKRAQRAGDMHYTAQKRADKFNRAAGDAAARDNQRIGPLRYPRTN